MKILSSLLLANFGFAAANTLDCGCAPASLVSAHITGGTGVAICTAKGKKGSKGAKWNIGCDANGNGKIDSNETSMKKLTMGKSCKLSGKKLPLKCDTPATSCKALESVQEANPNAMFVCVKGGKTEHLSCSIGNKTSEMTSGKLNKLVKWATSKACTETSKPTPTTCKHLAKYQKVNQFATFTCVSGGKTETVSCTVDDATSQETGNKKTLIKWAKSEACLPAITEANCVAGCDVSMFTDVTCVGKDQWGCTGLDGNLMTFTATKCKALKKAKCTKPTTPVASTCTSKSDGTCGTPPAVSVYQAFVFEGVLNTIGIDPHLGHLAHINDNAYVGAGDCKEAETAGAPGDGLIARVDVCTDISQYTNPLQVAVLAPTGTPNCATDYTWVWKSNMAGTNERFGFIATSPDKSYVIASGVRGPADGSNFQRWLVKLDANTGAEIWQISMDTTEANMSLRSGYETVAFTADGGFIAGGFADYDGSEFPPFKSGGQVDSGKPIFQKFSAAVAAQNTAFVTPPTPEWTYKCGLGNSCTAKGSSKNIRVYSDNGVEKVVTVPGVSAQVLVVNIADGSQAAFVDLKRTGTASGAGFNFQDIEPIMANGVVTGFAVTGLDNAMYGLGQENCIKADGCSTIRGHISHISADLATVTWNTPFNNFPGGTGTYAGLTKASELVVITECWGLTATKDATGTTTGFVAACGQGIEGCAGYLDGKVDAATLASCETDPRKGWRGLSVKVDMTGTMLWYRNNNDRAFEHISRGSNNQLVLVTDNGLGFGFHTLAVET